MNYEYDGILHKILPKIVTSSGFSKHEFILKTEEQYPQLIKFELRNDKCDLINSFNSGNNIKVSFNLRGKTWIDPTGKEIYFLSLVVWKIKKLENGYQVPINDKSSHLQYQMNLPAASEVFENSFDFKGNKYEDDENDLPF
jgi:hypothetical protein